MNPALTLMFIYKMGDYIVDEYMQMPAMKNFVSSNEKFDICVIEIFNADAFLVRTLI